MLNLKLLGFCVIVVAIALVFADKGGSDNAYNAAKNANASAVADIKGQMYCPSETAPNRTDCGAGSFAHHYECCSSNTSECCFALQIWVYVVLAVLVLAMIISTVVGIICCCCK